MAKKVEETEHEFWYRITKGEPGFTLFFKRSYREATGERDHAQWEIAAKVLLNPWVKVCRIVNNVKMYCVIPPPKRPITP